MLRFKIKPTVPASVLDASSSLSGSYMPTGSGPSRSTCLFASAISVTALTARSADTAPGLSGAWQ